MRSIENSFSTRARARAARSHRQRAIAQQVLDVARDRCRFVRSQHTGDAVLDDLRHSTHPARDHRNTVRHSQQRGRSQSLQLRNIDEQRGLRQILAEMARKRNRDVGQRRRLFDDPSCTCRDLRNRAPVCASAPSAARRRYRNAVVNHADASGVHSRVDQSLLHKFRHRDEVRRPMILPP